MISSVKMSTQDRKSNQHSHDSKDNGEDERQDLYLLALFFPIVHEFWFLSHRFYSRVQKRVKARTQRLGLRPGNAWAFSQG
jgi:hypothetical protein